MHCLSCVRNVANLDSNLGPVSGHQHVCMHEAQYAQGYALVLLKLDVRNELSGACLDPRLIPVYALIVDVEGLETGITCANNYICKHADHPCYSTKLYPFQRF